MPATWSRRSPKRRQDRGSSPGVVFRLIQKQDRLKSRVSPRANVHFFDATTHPLGASALLVKERTIFGRVLHLGH